MLNPDMPPVAWQALGVVSVLAGLGAVAAACSTALGEILPTGRVVQDDMLAQQGDEPHSRYVSSLLLMVV